MSRNLLLLSTAGLMALLLTHMVSGQKPSAPGGSPPFVHVVIFYLKPDAPKGEIDAFIKDVHGLLGKIPSVRHYRVGRPSEQASQWAIKAYDVALLVLFDDYDGLKSYLDHKLFKEFAARHDQYLDMSKMPVYDFIGQPSK